MSKINVIDFDDEDEFQEEEATTNTEVATEPTSEGEESELDRLKAENEALRLASAVKEIEVERPISMVEKYMKELGLESKEDLKEYLPILEEADKQAMVAYEAKIKLAELSKNPTIRKAQLENEALLELSNRGAEWEAEFFEVYEHADKLVNLNDTQRKDLIDFLSVELKKVMVDRKLNNKATINPMLLIQKDITKKLKSIVKPEQTKPTTDPKSLMSLSSSQTKSTSTKAYQPTQPLSNRVSHIASLFDIED